MVCNEKNGLSKYAPEKSDSGYSCFTRSKNADPASGHNTLRLSTVSSQVEVLKFVKETPVYTLASPIEEDWHQGDVLTFVCRMINQQCDLGEMTSFNLPLGIITNCDTIDSWSVVEVSISVSAIFVTGLVCGLCGICKCFIRKASKARKV